MRTHTNDYKTSIKGVRQIDTILKNIDTNTIISNDDLVKVKPILNAELLKSAMKQLDIESKIDIPLNTILNFKQGVLINNAYEYLDYGNYVVYESEYQADTKSYVITCYDKMLYSMIDYVTPIVNDAPITYPITIKNYLIAIATHLGLEFEDSTFTNQDKEIPNELYLDSFNRSLGYTFRDVLDELSQVTASCICINSNDKIEVRYVNENLTEISNKVGSNITETTIKAPIQLNNILGDLVQNGTPTPSTPIDIDTVTGLQKIQICGKNFININGTIVKREVASYSNINITNNTLSYNITTGTAGYLGFVTPVKVGQQYTLSFSNLSSGGKVYLIELDNAITEVGTNYGTQRASGYSFTASKPYVGVWLIANTDGGSYASVSNLMLEKGSTPTEYEEYNGKEYQINLGDIELCKIGDYQDKIYKSNRKWYIEKNYYKLTLKISDMNNGENYPGWKQLPDLPTYFPNQNTNLSSVTSWKSNITDNVNGYGLNTNNQSVLWLQKGTFNMTQTEWKTNFPNLVMNLYLKIPAPETTEITNNELINELNALYNAKSNNGTTNIIVYGDLSAILDANLGKLRETINEDYLKNINVTFGEKYGPVNSIVLSRSAGSDNIYKKDDASIEENGLCELKISDNQIMNFNDRDAYLNEIFDRLNGLEYYINDFDSPGITYLELLDKYDIQIEDEIYNCILLNDEIEINKGISERIFTDALEDSKTDYTKSDKTDRKINQAYIIVDKQNQTITALTSRTNDIENNETNHYNELVNKFDDYAPLTSVETLTTQVTQLQTDTYTKTQIQEIANGTGVDGVTVTAVISTEAQFDKDGMHYSKTDAPTNSTIDYKGFEVDDKNGKEIFYAGYDEDDQSPTYGTSIVRTDNINVDTYLQFGNNKGRFEEFEDANGNVGIGLFLM